MLRFAIRNLLARKIRTLLALIGLSVAIAGLVGLISFSIGLRAIMSSTADEIGGIMVLDARNPSPVFSRIDEQKVAQVAAVEGVSAVVREVLSPVLKMEGRSTLVSTSQGGGMFEGPPVYIGVDPAAQQRLRGGGYFVKHLVEGEYLPQDFSNKVLFSRRLAERFKDPGPDGKRGTEDDTPKTIGSPVRVMDQELEICGIFDSDNPLFRDVMVMHIDHAREILRLRDDVCTALFVEAEDVKETSAVAKRIVEQVPEVDAKSTEEWADLYGDLAKKVDVFLGIITSFAIIVGAIGIANTMLMSVTERVGEFGVLRATGWERGHVLRLVLSESLILGLTGGVVGLGGGALLAQGIGAALGLEPVISAELAGTAIGLAAVTGSLGGIYPAWRAAHLDVVDALRFRSL